jgi:hypothetical protein
MGRSVEADYDWAVNRKTEAPKLFAARASEQAILDERQNLELFPQLATEPLIDCLLRPLKQIGVPDGAVIERDGRNSTKDVIRPEAVCQVG